MFHSHTVNTVKGSLLSSLVNKHQYKCLQSVCRLLVFSQRPNKPDDRISCLTKHLQSVLKNNILKPRLCVIVCRPPNFFFPVLLLRRCYVFLCAATNNFRSVKKCKISGICVAYSFKLMRIHLSAPNVYVNTGCMSKRSIAPLAVKNFTGCL